VKKYGMDSIIILKFDRIYGIFWVFLFSATLVTGGKAAFPGGGDGMRTEKKKLKEGK
jgi:hypothetical protein